MRPVADFVDKTFLEPAAGHGNFLVAILHRKLRAVEKNYRLEEWPETSLFALASIYGIELLEDNHRDAKKAMLTEFLRFHEEHGVPCGPDTSLRSAAAFLIDTNVVCGDTLAGLDWRGEAIEFSWWNRIHGLPGWFSASRSRSLLCAATPSTSLSTTATGLAGSTRSMKE